MPRRTRERQKPTSSFGSSTFVKWRRLRSAINEATSLSQRLIVRGFESQTEVCATSRLYFDRRFSFQLTPAHDGATHGGGHRLDHYVVHHLAIAEALQEQPPQQTPALFTLKRESKTG